MEANIKFAKVHPNAIIPSKRDEDMGFDIYACFDEDYMIIYPHETKAVPTGIASSCDKEFGFILKERSSTGSKGIALRAGVVDSGYRGQWYVVLTNTTDKTLFISKLSEEETYDKHYGATMKHSFVYPYTKAIAQAVVKEVIKTNVEELSYEELQSITSERGTGAFGSSNK